MGPHFKLLSTDKASKARRGRIGTLHGNIETPAFCPVGTQATVKTMKPHELQEIGIEMILANTYHLYLRPGTDVISHFNGLHNFMCWQGPILTDSGGYQVFSLSDNMRILPDGVEFRSHIDGSKHFFSPENVILIQNILGSDIAMVLDECPPYPSERNYIKHSMDRTISWAKKCITAQKNESQQLWAIVQGGMFADLRKECAEGLIEMDFPGYALGGLSVGEPKPVMNEVLSYAVDYLPSDKPRYVMGVGTPEDILFAVECGVDLFDCALPTRNARNGTVFSYKCKIMMRNASHKFDKTPIDPDCNCYTCRNFSRSYIRHLLNVEEILGLALTTYHNLYFMESFMKDIKRSIENNSFLTFKNDFLSKFFF